MFDRMQFDPEFEPPVDVPVDLSARTWQSKGVCGIPSSRTFRITADGLLEQHDDEGWIRRRNTEMGRFYKSFSPDGCDGRRYYSFNITFEGGVVTDIELAKEKVLD